MGVLIRSLTALTAPIGTDILYVVDDPGGTPLDRKATVNTLHKAGVGVDEVTDNAAGQVLTADTWTKLTCNNHTQLSTYRPTWTSSSLWDSSNNRLRLTDVPTGTLLMIQVELDWSPAATSTLRLRLAHDSAASAAPIVSPTRVQEIHLATASTGTLSLVQPILLMVNSTVKSSWVELQAYCDEADTVNVTGLVIGALGVA
jgi:hypothetical protein